MTEIITKIKEAAAAFSITNVDSLEQYRLEFMSRKGKLNDLFEQFKQTGAEEKKAIGKPLNELKKFIEEKYETYKQNLESQQDGDSGRDLSLPVVPQEIGSRHPLRLVEEQILEIFNRIGFSVAEGPEIEKDWYNFSALNFPENHPARDMQDTFFIDPETSLRTHTSSVQIRSLESHKPPIRIMAPGRVYRNEAVSARAHCFFHQVEGLYVDEGVSFADLKHTLYYFVKEMFGEDIDLRFRASYFPFTEVSAEMDISCLLCKGKGCNVCKHTGWVEILGCGMVDPQVLENCKIDSTKYTGYAFGMGIERISMLKYNIRDLRLFSQNDQRLLQQFESSS